MTRDLKNDRFIRALCHEPVDCTPIWIMRQAGRYLPEYRATRAKAGSFMDLCHSADLACEVTLQPLERFDLDAAILFSDILTVPDAMGLGLSFAAGEGPVFARPLRSRAAIEQLPIPDPENELRYVMDAVSTIRRALDGRVPLIGFSGSPWTLATYMVEGGATKEFAHIKGLMYSDPATAHLLLDKLSHAVTDYLNAQVRNGAQALMVFDTWGGVLSPEKYEAFSLRYMEKIVDGLIRNQDGQRIPVILFTKGGGQWASRIAQSGADGIGLDWTVDIGTVRRSLDQAGDRKIALQGNLDPSVLYATDDVIEQEVARVLASYGHGSGHVFNLGHGIHQHIDPARVKTLVDAVHRLSRPYHSA
ncbi:uroporphyrinogen decarboxylase [Halothiobacillus diazotrophicus]|uniref:Uroporphyrinogen decarboxylase n=1 Tax=Halothiobacillus diazotrophicus TaxID=1860122 RepID=A0A191ZGV8_9GAMM|nr:uroporphyrinogen decarboxylase [Halothiobacillus diazotrophicus]ANJ67121.1 uroporphyrinogen decarboxylase [Halothiobacillus diazotrophicus]